METAYFRIPTKEEFKAGMRDVYSSLIEQHRSLGNHDHALMLEVAYERNYGNMKPTGYLLQSVENK